MKQLLFTGLLCVVFVFTACAQNSPSFNLKEIGNPKIESILKKELKKLPPNINLAFALIDKESTQYFGVTRKKDSFIVCDNKAQIFEIGSITKVFTTSLLAQLIVEKKVTLEDKIGGLLPITMSQGNDISLLELATHSSGLERFDMAYFENETIDMDNPYKDYSLSMMYNYLQKDLKIGAKTYAYSNMGMALLGQIIALKQDKSYADVLQANILNPLGMSSTYLQKVGVVKQLVQGIDATGNSVSAWDFKAIAPAGGLKSNVLDMEKFARHQLNHNSLTHLKQFNINPQMDMALGWHVLKIKGKSYIWHNGGTGGFTAALVLDKTAQKAVVILSNTSPGVFAEKHTNLDKIALSLIQSF